MENKSYLYYVLAAIVVIVVIAALLWFGKTKSVAPQSESDNLPALGNPAPATLDDTPATGEPAVPGVNGPASAVNSTDTPAASSATDSGLIGTWISSTTGKGMQGSGKVELNGITYQLSLSGHVTLIIDKVENNTGTGTITFNNVCINGTKSVAGKAATAISPQCTETYSKPADLQIDGNKISWSGKSDLGADITLTGTYDSTSMSGTFTRTSKQGNIDGTFSLMKSK